MSGAGGRRRAAASERGSRSPAPADPTTAADSHWLPIPGHPDYEVSDGGEVRCRGGGGASGGLLVFVGGSPAFRLADTGELRLVCHLVLEAFRGPCPEHGEAEHLNGDAGDNHLANLAWLGGDAVRELALRSDRSLRTTRLQDVSAAVVRYLRRRYAAGDVTTARLAWECGLPQPAVCSLVAPSERNSNRQHERQPPKRRGGFAASLGVPPKIKRRPRRK